MCFGFYILQLTLIMYVWFIFYILHLKQDHSCFWFIIIQTKKDDLYSPKFIQLNLGVHIQLRYKTEGQSSHTTEGQSSYNWRSNLTTTSPELTSCNNSLLVICPIDFLVSSKISFSRISDLPRKSATCNHSNIYDISNTRIYF